MDWLILRTVGEKEIRAALRNRWFLLYTGLFLILSVAFATAAMSGSTLTGQPGFGRTSAGLMNLMLLIVPLIGLTVGAQVIVAERENRFLEYELSQPLRPVEVYLGMYLGAAASLCLVLAFGLGLAGVVMGLRGGTAGIDDFLLLVLLTMLLGLGMLSVGFLVSSFAPRTATALGIALTLWLFFVMLGDLGLMGSAAVMKMTPGTLLGLTLLNPLDTYKLAGMNLMQSSLEVLGPAGAYAIDHLGSWLTVLVLALLTLWIVAPLPIGYWLFRRADFR
ncbi:MAG: ABC transporter permease subunit [Thermomicrobiales bacterium]|nr:ABC transporter permease subunit [Thermomicrobiales bacterium]